MSHVSTCHVARAVTVRRRNAMVMHAFSDSVYRRRNCSSCPDLHLGTCKDLEAGFRLEVAAAVRYQACMKTALIVKMSNVARLYRYHFDRLMASIPRLEAQQCRCDQILAVAWAVAQVGIGRSRPGHAESALPAATTRELLVAASIVSCATLKTIGMSFIPDRGRAIGS